MTTKVAVTKPCRNGC